MSAPQLTKTAKPLSIALTSLLVLTLLSTTSAATQGISATYSLQGNMTTSMDRHYSLSGLRSYFINESRDASVSASGIITVTWMSDGRSASGNISITRDASFTLYLNSTKPSTGSEKENTNITFSGTGSEEAFDLLGPLMGHPTGTLENVTIKGQTYLAVHATRSVSTSYTASAQETFTKTGDGGHTVTVTVSKSVTRNISVSADFWFSKASGILLKSSILGNISVHVSVAGNITGLLGGSESFTMTATYTNSFKRNVMATSISGLSG